jgi:hypothetical protein
MVARDSNSRSGSSASGKANRCLSNGTKSSKQLENAGAQGRDRTADTRIFSQRFKQVELIRWRPGGDSAYRKNGVQGLFV